MAVTPCVYLDYRLAWPGLAWPGPGLAWPGLAWPGLAWLTRHIHEWLAPLMYREPNL